MSTYVQLGDQKIIYDWNVNKYNRLLRKYFSMVDKVIVRYGEFLDKAKYDGSFPSQAEEVAYQCIEAMFNSLSDELAALGYYGLSYEQMKKEPYFYLNVQKPLDKVFFDLRKEINIIIQQRDHEINGIAMRQASRGRVIGGGFGVKGFVKGALMAKGINSVRDAWYSSGDRADAQYARKLANRAAFDLFSDFEEKICQAFRKASLSFYKTIVSKLGLYEIKLSPEEAETIVNKICDGTIKNEHVFPALVQALNVFPYNRDIYDLFMITSPEYYKDIEEIGRIFLMDSKLIFDEYHEFDGFYFDDPQDRLFALNHIGVPVYQIQNELYPDTKDILYKNPEHFMKNHDFPFIDKIIALLESITIDPEKTQVAEYHARELNFFKKIRTEMEINYIPRYEAVVTLAKGYTKYSKNKGNMFTAYSMSNDMLDTVNKYCPSLHKNDQYITFQSDNQAIAVMTLEELVLINIPLDSSKSEERIKTLFLKYEDLTECSLTNQVLTCKKSTSDAVSYKFILPDKCKSAFNQAISSFIDTDKMDEKLKELIIAKHKKAESILSKEELIKRETDILNRTYDGVRYETQDEVDRIKAEIERIRNLTNEAVFATDLKTLASWKTALMHENIVTESGKELVEKICRLSTYEQKDLDILQTVTTDQFFPPAILVTTKNNFLEVQETCETNPKEIVICMMLDREDDISVDWCLTTRNYYDGDSIIPLNDFLHMTRMGNSLFCVYYDDEEDIIDQVLICPDMPAEYLDQLAVLVNRTVHTYLLQSLPESISMLTSGDYYYWTKIFDAMLSYSQHFNEDKIYDGTKLSTFDNPDHEKRRKFAGESSFIFKYIDTTVFGSGYGMGVNHNGLNILVTDNSDNPISAFYTWDELTEVEISAYVKFSGAFLVIGDNKYPLGATGASTEKWCEYIKNMVGIYHSALLDYPDYVEEFSNSFDGVEFDTHKDKQFVKESIHNKILNIQAKYPELIDTAYADKDYLLEKLNFRFVDDVITFLEGLSIPAENTKIREYVENKKRFYISLRQEMEDASAKRPVRDGILQIQKKYTTEKTAYAKKGYFLESLNFEFVDEILAFLQGMKVDSANTRLHDYVEEQKGFYGIVRKEMKDLADKNSINEAILNIQANHGIKKRNAYEDKEYFINNLNLPFINDIITYLEGLSFAPEKTEVLKLIEDKKDFYLPLRKEMEDIANECNEIYGITNNEVFSNNVEELKTWNAALATKDFHTEKAKQYVEKVQALASYSQKDFDFYSSVASILPKGKGITTVDANNFVRVQKEFQAKMHNNEIVLCYTEDGIGVKAWMLTTQHFYIAREVFKLSDVLQVFNIDNYLLLIAEANNGPQPGKGSPSRTFVVQSKLNKDQLISIARSLNSIFCIYLEKNLPETSAKILTKAYYFYNVIMQQLIKSSDSFVLPHVKDGTNIPMNDRTKDISGNKTDFIFRYVETTRNTGNRGMALTDQGLFIKQDKESERIHFTWEQLANAVITVKKSFFSKDDLIINGVIYSMGNSEAKTEDWAYYLNKMIEVYNGCLSSYSSFVQKLRSHPAFSPLPGTPSPQYNTYVPPQPAPASVQPGSRFTERCDNTSDNKPSQKSMFSSFTSTFRSNSKSALDKMTDVGMKTTASLAASFMKGSKSAFDKIKDAGSKASEGVFSSSGVTNHAPASKTDGAKICPKCGSPIAKDKLFCGNCGTKYTALQKCPVCGAVVEEGKNFCGICGTKVGVARPRFCANCGSKLADGVKFCGNCGAKV